MAENKIQENPLPDTLEPVDKPKDAPKPADKTPVAAPVPVPVVPISSNRFSIPSLTKTPPNELYRKLLPAVLFLLTFVTVMTMLLIYMDTVALGAQQFRLNMSRDYELARIPQDSPTLVAYVRQLHLAPRAPKGTPPAPSSTDRLKVLDSLFGELHNGTFVEFLPAGGRDPTAAFLERERGWRGVAVRAAPRDFLALRGAASALHACLSPTDHPREVTFQEADGASLFSSRVLCLPLYTVLLAGQAVEAQYVLLAGTAVPRALTHVPFQEVHLQVIEFRSTDPEARNQTTTFLQSKNYTIAATFDDGIKRFGNLTSIVQHFLKPKYGVQARVIFIRVSSQLKDGVTTITYRRPLAAKEPMKDKEVLTSRSQSVIAAFGPLNSRYEANAHSFMDTTRADVQLDFGAQNDNTCVGLAELEADGTAPWPPRILIGTPTMTARIGPAGGKRGYTPITGHPSWGIAWYINDLLIPEIYVERGQTYTFLVEGGDDRTNPAKFHPFYISDSSEGGFGQKKEEDQRKQRVFAGVAYDNEGYPYPTAVGRYCEWAHKTTDQAATSPTFEDYMKTLQLECNEGEPAVLNWTVAHETPDLLYYQCYSHNNLGWKIHVVDPGAPMPQPADRASAAPPRAPLARLTPLAPLAPFFILALNLDR